MSTTLVDLFDDNTMEIINITDEIQLKQKRKTNYTYGKPNDCINNDCINNDYTCD